MKKKKLKALKKRIEPGSAMKEFIDNGLDGWMLVRLSYLEPNAYGRYPDVELVLMQTVRNLESPLQNLTLNFKGVERFLVDGMQGNSSLDMKESVRACKLTLKKKRLRFECVFFSGLRVKIRCRKLLHENSD